jgi:predicted RNase H-like HicB family nuclease
MRYAILVQQRPDGMFQASVPVIPGLTRSGTSREETLQAIEQALVATLTTSEIVYLDLPAAPQMNPWLATAGLFADDPTLEPMLEEIYDARDRE